MMYVSANEKAVSLNVHRYTAEELLECEMELNEQVHFNAKGTCARYMVGLYLLQSITFT
jgi:hypothetical protein